MMGSFDQELSLDKFIAASLTYKCLAIFCCCFLMLIIAYFVDLNLLRTSLQINQQAFINEQQQYQQQQQLLSKLQVNNKLNGVDGEGNYIYSCLIQQKTTNQILLKILHIGEQLGLEFKEVKPLTRQNNTYYSIYPFQLVVLGGYDLLLQWLNQITQLPVLWGINLLHLQVESWPETNNAKPKPLLKLALSLQLYYKTPANQQAWGMQLQSFMLLDKHFQHRLEEVASASTLAATISKARYLSPFRHVLALAPALNITREPLTHFPISQLSLVGIITEHRMFQQLALIMTPTGQVYAARPGTAIGQNHGQVCSIGVNSIEIQERIKHQEKWLVHKVVLALAHSEDNNNS